MIPTWRARGERSKAAEGTNKSEAGLNPKSAEGVRFEWGRVAAEGLYAVGDMSVPHTVLAEEGTEGNTWRTSSRNKNGSNGKANRVVDVVLFSKGAEKRRQP